MTWIQTFTGVAFDYVEVFKRGVTAETLDLIDIQDIAHAISHSCRFNGHTKWFYSVAQHSRIGSEVCDPQFAKWFLMHDAAETYVGDLVKPIKEFKELEIFKRLEDTILQIIAEKFSLPFPMPHEIHEIDMRMLATEQAQLFMAPPYPWKSTEGWDPYDVVIEIEYPEIAEARFLNRYGELFSC